MKHVILLLLSFLPILLYAQYPNNPNKIRLGFQTTGNGLIYRGSGAPTQFPTGYNSPFQQYDTVANILWVYQDSFWYATNTVRRATPPPYSSTSSGLTLVYGHATWQDSDDEQRYEYVANDSIEAWVPAVGIHYAISEPADIAATPTTGAVEYTAALWNKVPTDSLFRHDGANWVFIGKSGPHFVRGDSGALQDIAEGDTLTITGGYGIDIVTASGDTVTVIVDTTQIATPYDLTQISTSFVVDADTGTPQTIASGDTLQINSGWGVNTTVGATGLITVSGDSTQVATQHDISAHISGPLTSGRIPRATGTYTLSDGVLRDDGTLLALGGATVSGYSFYDYSTGGWRLATGTTAQRPTNIAGVHRYNTSLGYSETANGSAWLQSDFPVGTSGQTLRHNGTSWIANSFLYNTGSAISINTTDTDALLNLEATATASPIRERFLVAKVSDDTVSQFFIGNATITDTRLNPVFGGYTPHSVGLIIRGLLEPADVTTSDAALIFQGAVTNNASDPNSGTLSTISSAKHSRFIEGGSTEILTIWGAGNVDINSTGYLKIPVGTTAQRPTVATGQTRYNTSNGALEYYGASAWEIPLKSSTSTGLGTTGRVFYANSAGRAAGDDNLYWDATNDRLGIGSGAASPAGIIDAVTSSNGNILSRLYNTSTGNAARAQIQVRADSIGASIYNTFNTASFATTYTLQTYLTNNSVIGRSSSSAANGRLIIQNHHIGGGRKYISFHLNAGAATTTNLDETSKYFEIGETEINVNDLSADVDFRIESDADQNNFFSDAGNNRVGIGTNTPARKLHVEGEARITDLATDPATKIVGADADGDLSAEAPGYGLTFTSGVLRVDTAQIATLSDISSLGNTIYTGDGGWSGERNITITPASDTASLNILTDSSTVKIGRSAQTGPADIIEGINNKFDAGGTITGEFLTGGDENGNVYNYYRIEETRGDTSWYMRTFEGYDGQAYLSKEYFYSDAYSNGGFSLNFVDTSGFTIETTNQSGQAGMSGNDGHLYMFGTVDVSLRSKQFRAESPDGATIGEIPINHSRVGEKTVQNTSTKTSLIPVDGYGATDFTLNYLPVTGSGAKFEVWGYFTTAASNTNIEISIEQESNSIGTTGTRTLNAGGTGMFKIEIITQRISSSELWTQGTAVFYDDDGTSQTFVIKNTAENAGVNFGADINFDVFADWTTADPDNNITATNFLITKF